MISEERLVVSTKETQTQVIYPIIWIICISVTISRQMLGFTLVSTCKILTSVWAAEGLHGGGGDI